MSAPDTEIDDLREPTALVCVVPLARSLDDLHAAADIFPGPVPRLELVSTHSTPGCTPTTGPRGLYAIVPGVLYLGSHREATSLANVRAANIQAYLCAAREIANPLPSFVDPADVAAGRVGALHLPLSDGPTTRITDCLPQAFAFIDKHVAAGRPVALFCQQGRSRSVSIAIAYMMREHRINSETALGRLTRAYPQADPNLFFLAQLSALDPDNMLNASAPPALDMLAIRESQLDLRSPASLISAELSCESSSAEYPSRLAFRFANATIALASASSSQPAPAGGEGDWHATGDTSTDGF